LSRTNFRPAGTERISGAAKASSTIEQIDLRTLIVTHHPNPEKGEVDPVSWLDAAATTVARHAA
jgi:hypothetical protein